MQFELSVEEITRRCTDGTRRVINSKIVQSALKAEEKWCERRDSNSHRLPYWNLNPARLPIPPLSHNLLGWMMGLEPTTTGITIQGSTN